MSRIGSVVRRVYATELRPAVDDSNGDDRPRPRRKKIKQPSRFKKVLKSRRTLVWGFRIFMALAASGVIAECVFHFNRLTRGSTAVAARRADVERELKRRENLIPNLVAIAGDYAVYELRAFQYIADARDALKAIQDTDAPGPQTALGLEAVLSKFIAWAEQYPDLKATQSIQDLIKEAANTEDRIAEAKGEHNKACELYMQYRSVFPGNIFAFLYGFKPLPYIGQEEGADVPAIRLDLTPREAGTNGKSQYQAATQ